ncbi:MAG: hypothetical protein ACYCVZ_17105 [Streptosporangiaceae bacterium]
MRLARFSRGEFLTERWDHQPGESVFFCQPSQGGKTEWAFQLLAATDHENPPVALVMKPRDPTPAKWTRRLDWREVRAWPPPRVWPWQNPPPGYTLWPRHELSLDPASIARTNASLKRHFEACLMDAYKNGDRIVFVDEIYGLLAELGMEQVINALLTRGMGMGAGLWYATQKPSGTPGHPMPGFVFNSFIHGFFGYDPVAANRKRFSEISGINADLVADTVAHLNVYPTETPRGKKPISEMLYINRNGPRGGYMCIIEPW